MHQQTTPARSRPTSRSRLSLIVLLTMTAIGIVLCATIISPFVPALTWALALAIVAMPMHQFIRRHVTYPSIAAGMSTVIVALVLVCPALFVGWQIGAQAGERLDQAQQMLESGQLRQSLNRFPAAAKLYDSIVNGDGPTPTEIAQPVANTAAGWVRAALGAIVQVLIALFSLFFLFRDRDMALRAVQSLMPMSTEEATYFFEQIRGMTHATIYGTVVVSMIQGTLGGLMFFLLGIPAALLWGVAMALLSIIPSAGAFVIWLPTAAFLAAQGEATKAIILAAWGAFAVGTIDNVLYPLLVGREMRLHQLPVFFAIVGGVFTFGAAGIVLGPVALAATIALLDILRRRTAKGRPAEQPTEKSIGGNRDIGVSG